MSYFKLATFERQAPVHELDDTGGEWLKLFSAYVKLEPLSARELLNIPQGQGQVTHRVKTYWRDGLEPLDRIKLGERALNISSVINVREQNLELELLCVEVV